ncbi:uncharacterized protein DEA37_0003225, partial [Paragonimus westermani]
MFMTSVSHMLAESEDLNAGRRLPTPLESGVTNSPSLLTGNRSSRSRESVAITATSPCGAPLWPSCGVASMRQRAHIPYSNTERPASPGLCQFTNDIRHIPGDQNVVADALSRPEMDSMDTSSNVDSAEMARLQKEEQQLSASTTVPRSLNIKPIPLYAHPGTVGCDISTTIPRPLMSSAIRRHVFNALYNVSQPGIRATVRLIAQRFVWPNMNKEIRGWAKVASAVSVLK